MRKFRKTEISKVYFNNDSCLLYSDSIKKIKNKSLILTMILVFLLLTSAPNKSKANSIEPVSDIPENDWQLIFNEEFSDPILDKSKFNDENYLIHWTTPDNARAKYTLADGNISLNIPKEPAPWWHGTDKQKLSSIQTGMRDGMHRFDKNLCTITDHHPAINNFITQYGYFELRAKVPSAGGIHSAWWMIGAENFRNQQAEIDIFEILGPEVGPKWSKVRAGVHPWGDPEIRRETLYYHVKADLESDFHTYGFLWEPEGMKFYFDGKLVRTSKQSPNYKMLTLLGIYEGWNGITWSKNPDPNDTNYPKQFTIDYFRAYQTPEMIKFNQDRDLALKKKAMAENNLALLATTGVGQDYHWTSLPSHLNDGDNSENSAFQSQDFKKNSTNEFSKILDTPEYLYFDWEDIQTISEVSLDIRYALLQAPTNWDIEYSLDGKSNWKQIAQSGNVQWNTADNNLESKTISFPTIHAKAIRIKINSVNIYWNHYAINEVRIGS